MATIAGATGVSEIAAPIRGFITLCVQASENVITGIYKVLPTSPQNTQRLGWDQIARGEAVTSGPKEGASNYGSASAQLSRLGIPNVVYTPDWMSQHNWVQKINGALGQGKPILVGVHNATALQDSVTGSMPDIGVYGHGLTIVGADQNGYLVADPNTPAGAPFMHYTAANLNQAGIDSLVIPNDAPKAVIATDSGGTSGSGGTSWQDQLSGAAFQAGSDVASGVSNPLDPRAWGQGVAQGALGVITAPLEGAGIRIVLMLAALTLIVVALFAFLFAGSGRQVVVEGSKAAVKGGTKALAS